MTDLSSVYAPLYILLFYLDRQLYQTFYPDIDWHDDLCAATKYDPLNHFICISLVSFSFLRLLDLLFCRQCCPITTSRSNKVSSLPFALSMDSKSQEVGSFTSLIPQMTTKMEEEKGRFIAFNLKTRVGQPADAT
jgi:hypothetical protein